MGTARTVIRKLFVLLVGEGAARLLGVATFAVLARALGLADLGVFSFGISLALVLECLMDFGQNAQLGKAVAEDAETGLAQFTHAAANKTGIGVVLAALVALVMTVARFSAQETATVVLLITWATGLSVLDGLRSAARSLERFRLDSAVNSAESLLRFGAVACVWAFGGGLVAFGAVFAVESWAAVAVVWGVLGRRHGKLFARPSGVDDLRRFLWTAAPFGIAVMSLSAFYNLDQVFVRTIVGASANGLYGAAARISTTASVVGSLLAMVAYPDLARMRADAGAFRRYLARALGLALGIGSVAAVAVLVWAAPLLGLLFGAEFSAAADILRVLAIVIVFRGVSSVALYAANARGQSRRIAVIAIAFALVNLSANILLLPHYGALAAAWISGAGEVALACVLVSVALGRTGAAPAMEAEVIADARG